MATFINDQETILSVEFNHNGASTVDAYIDVPENTDITDLAFDVVTAITGATAFGVTAGSTAGGVDYSASVNVFAGGRFKPTFTTAQLAALWAVQPSGGQTAMKRVYFRGTPTGTATAGRVRCVVWAKQRALS